ncbi:MAG: hypothetical protein IJ747_08800 [Lachnospiraceae bacterium]|nr:hypothetical protein [Lachnospiraceae bacterium]
MIFKCANCGGNVVYSPEKKKMVCPYCESEESQQIQYAGYKQITICPDCSGEVPVDEFTAATQCPYCSNYLILDERVEGAFLPKQMIPFRMGKETCKKALREKFGKQIFAPTDFLSEARLNSMEGTYVPFWFFDYDVNAIYSGEGRKVRSWTSGSTEYTETSYYDVRRNMDITYQNIPVDASIPMPDPVMDLMEPYDYQELSDFDPKYLSGFYAERFNLTAEQLKARADQKMRADTAELLKAEVSGYSGVTEKENVSCIRREEASYGLLPVWKYNYTYNGQDYPFYVNGQTGKIVGTVPLSTKKVWAYAGTLWACLAAIGVCIGLLPLIIL